MSNQVWSSLGISAAFSILFNNDRPVDTNLYLGLYTNDVSLISSTVVGDFTSASGGGYSVKALSIGNFSVSVVSGIAQALFDKQVFEFTGPLDNSASVYGYYVVDGDGIYWFGQAFENPVVPSASGHHIDVTPKVQGSFGTPQA